MPWPGNVFDPISLITFATLIERRYRRRMKATLVVFLLGVALAFAGEPEDKLRPSLETITPDGMLAHIKALSSDEFEGRAPGTAGEEHSVNYLTEQLKRLNLKPGNPDGTFSQQVPLAGITSDPQMSFSAGDKELSLKFPDDFVA